MFMITLVCPNDRLPTGCQQVTDCWPTVGLKHNANCWPTVGRPSANSQPTVHCGIKLADFPVPIEGLFLKCKVSTFREHSFQFKAFVSPTIFPDQFGIDMIPCDIFPATKQSPHGVASDTKGLPTCMPHPGGEGWDLDWY